MSRFLVNFGIFLVVYAISTLTLLVTFSLIDREINKQILDSNHTAVIGHSHAQLSVNDSLLSKIIESDVTNHSEGGQSMFWTTVGARKLRSQGVKIFLVELSNRTYTTGWKTTDELRALRESSKIYFLGLEDWQFLFRNDFMFTLKLIFKVPLPTTSVLGKFLRRNQEFRSEVVKENRSNEFVPDFDDQILHDFIKSSDSVLFVIFRAPQHPKLYDIMDPNNERYFVEKFGSFEKYQNCVLMDFGHFYRSDSLFSDLAHMNFRGSKVFTELLGDTLRNTYQFKHAQAY